MGLKKLNSLILIGAIILCAVSCKDDDDITVSPTLDGYLRFSVPGFIKQNTKLTFTPKGVSHPDDEELGYYWKVSPTMTKYDTTRFENGLDKYGNPSDGSFTHTFSDTLQTYSVYGYAYAAGYSSESAGYQCTVVKGGIDGSVKMDNLSEGTPHEDINGNTYYYTTVNDTDWLVLNLDNSSAGGAPYSNCKAMSDVFGRFYSYEEAKTACPEGWTLPTDEDWVELAKYAGSEDAKVHENIAAVAAALMGDADFNETRMWEYWPEVGEITNTTGLSIIPVGYATLGDKDTAASNEDPNFDFTYPDAIFRGYKEYAAFWTADTVDGEEGMAYYRYLINKQPNLMIGKGNITSFGASVRCVRKN